MTHSPLAVITAERTRALKRDSTFRGAPGFSPSRSRTRQRRGKRDGASRKRGAFSSFVSQRNRNSPPLSVKARVSASPGGRPAQQRASRPLSTSHIFASVPAQKANRRPSPLKASP